MQNNFASFNTSKVSIVKIDYEEQYKYQSRTISEVFKFLQ